MKKMIWLAMIPAMTFAQTNLPDHNQVKGVMNQVYESFSNLLPYIYGNKNIDDPKNKDYILGNLNNISQAFKSAKHTKILELPGFRPSLETMQEQLKLTQDAFGQKNKSFAQARLNSLTGLCVSCHSQLSDNFAQNSFSDALVSVKRDRFETDYQYANYLFLVRKYTDAARYFEMTIESQLVKNKQSLKEKRNVFLDDKILMGELYTSLKKVLSISTAIKYDPDKAIKFLNKYKGRSEISKITRSDIDQWIEELTKLKKEKFPNELKSAAEAREFMQKYLGRINPEEVTIYDGSKDVTLMVVSGILSRFLTENPKTEMTGEILYWKAVAERRLNSNYFFSLADFYLKECMSKFSKQLVAKRCFREYEDALTFGYTGSSGTDIPDDLRVELAKFKKMVE